MSSHYRPSTEGSLPGGLCSFRLTDGEPFVEPIRYTNDQGEKVEFYFLVLLKVLEFQFFLSRLWHYSTFATPEVKMSKNFSPNLRPGGEEVSYSGC